MSRVIAKIFKKKQKKIKICYNKAQIIVKDGVFTVFYLQISPFLHDKKNKPTLLAFSFVVFSFFYATVNNCSSNNSFDVANPNTCRG